MNRLQLCQRLRQEVRISGSGPTTTLGQAGEYKKIVDWIDAAYEDIQNLHSTWMFLQFPYSFNTIVGKKDYTPTEAGLTALAFWKVQRESDVRCYYAVGDEQILDYHPWDEFREVYLIGSSRATTGRPGKFTIQPNNTMSFDVIPDRIYAINGEYFKKPVSMAADADEPLFPSQYHMAIVYRAMMFYGADYAANEKYTHGQNEYKKILRKLEQSQLPKYSWGGPLV